MNIDNVLELARLGLRVHPLRGKVPILAKWQERATTDEKIIRLWHSQYPDCNIGLATGKESGVFVVDLDPKAGGLESWNFLLDEHGAPDTWTSITGSGGRHLFFAWPKGAEIRNSSGKIGRGIDIRGEAGNIVLPGSVHPNGTVYQWEAGKSPKDLKLAKAPKWLMDLIMEETGAEYAPLGGLLEKGNRNNSLYHSALALARQGAEKDFVISALKKWIEDQHQDIPEDEVLKTVASAFEAAKAKPIDISDKSDYMNAELLIQSYGEDLIYVNGIGWHHWNGKCWEPDVDDVIVRQLFVKCMRALQEDAAQRMASSRSKTEMKEAAAIATWAVRSLSAHAISAAVELASTVPGVRKTPDEIDGANTLWLLNCANGTLDLKKGELREHRKTDYITKLVNVDYDPNATAPFWESTLNLIFDGNRELIDYMQRALGYSITGSQDERCFFIVWGEAGANGKSTVLETIQDLLGTGYAQMSSMDVITSSTNDNRVQAALAKLQGARFVSMNEAEENQKLSESLIKQLTGGDTVQACYKYKNPFEYKPVFKLWIRTNEKPTIHSQNNAIWDRVKLIPFERSIPKAQRLPRSEVDSRLRAEMPGILTWLVRGCSAWLKAGHLVDPPEVTAAVQGYRVDSDIVRSFVDESIEPKVGNKLKTQDAYQAFVIWCKEGGERYIMTKSKFTRRMKAIGYNMDRANGQNYFKDIALTQSAAMFIM